MNETALSRIADIKSSSYGFATARGFSRTMRLSTETPPLTREDVAAIYRAPVLDLILRAAEVHRRHHTPGEVQVCVLLSVKTGGCA